MFSEDQDHPERGQPIKDLGTTTGQQQQHHRITEDHNLHESVEVVEAGCQEHCEVREVAESNARSPRSP